jgi:hypothetical protein
MSGTLTRAERGRADVEHLLVAVRGHHEADQQAAVRAPRLG